MAPIIDRQQATQVVTLLAMLFLASLTIKAWQEVAGVRVLSTCLPLFFLYLLSYSACPITVPRPVLLLLFVECIILPTSSAISRGNISFYELYLPWTAVSAVIFISYYRNFLSARLERLGELYALSLIPVCVLSYVFTSDQTWFGAYQLASLSDFSTFFAMQLSLAIPFVLFRWKNGVILFFLITLWFLFSRLSFVLSIITLMVQRSRFTGLRSLLANVTTAGVVILTMFLLAQTSLGKELSSKLVNTASSLFGTNDSTLIELNPSDIGRLAYIVTTLDAITPISFFFGHGIRTNHEIILEDLDTEAWGLAESFSNGAVHNVYVEIFSDCGVFALLGLSSVVLYILSRLRRRGWHDPVFLASIVFFVSYFFEANYVTFFFQFFLIYFLWLASLTPAKNVPLSTFKAELTCTFDAASKL